MEQLQKDIVNMKKEKMTLFVSTTAFRRNLLNLLGELKQIYDGKWKVYLSVVRNIHQMVDNSIECC